MNTYHVHEEMGGNKLRLCTGLLPCSKPLYRWIGDFSSIESIYGYLDRIEAPKEKSYDLEYPRPKKLERCSETIKSATSGADDINPCFVLGEHDWHKTSITGGTLVQWK